MRISIIGCGRLGVPYAATMAALGHHVLGLDTDPGAVARLNSGDAFGEPGLAETLAHHLNAGHLAFTTSYDDAADFAQVHFLCVPTPQQAHHTAADLCAIHAATTTLAPRLTRNTAIVVKSSVPVGTTARLGAAARSAARSGVDVEVSCSPDFLRESTSLADARSPARLVLGLPPASVFTEGLLRCAWKPFIDTNISLIVTDLATAELSKSAANTYLATKTSFINAWTRLCDTTGGDVLTLSRILALDPRIGPDGLTPGLGFGGSCIAKDIRAAATRAAELGLSDLDFLHHMDSLNQSMRDLVVDTARELCSGSLAGARIALWGLAFKPGVDDVSDSPALDVATRLSAEGARLRCYDPLAMANADQVAPQLAYCSTAAEAAEQADLIVHLTGWEEFKDLDPAELKTRVRTAAILDARHTLPHEDWQAAGWTYRAPGRARQQDQH